MNARTTKKTQEVNPEAMVEAYLREHPDFFERHVTLLDVLRVPHRAGGSISLVERQVTFLREKHRFLEQRLAELVERARDNERVGHHLHRLACTLMHADSLDAVLALTQEALRDVAKAELVSIRLLSPEHHDLHRLRSEDLHEFEDLFTRGRAQCGRLPRGMLHGMFGTDAAAVGSAIMVPLLANSERQGVLALGSRSSDRFQSDMGTYFLTHLGELLAEAIRSHRVRIPLTAA